VKHDPRVWSLWIFLETPRDNRFLLSKYRKYATEYIAEGRYNSIYKRNGADLSKENKKLKAKLRKITAVVNDSDFDDSDTDDST